MTAYEVPNSLKGLWNKWKLEEIVSSCKLLKQGRLSKEDERNLRRRIRHVIRELAFEIITTKYQPMTVNQIANELLNINNEILVSTNYLEAITTAVGNEAKTRQFVRELLSKCRFGLENIEKTVERLLSYEKGIFKTDDELFWSRSWPLETVFKICVQLASEYRTKDNIMKEKYKNKAISLLEENWVDFPNRENLIQTLRRM